MGVHHLLEVVVDHQLLVVIEHMSALLMYGVQVLGLHQLLEYWHQTKHQPRCGHRVQKQDLVAHNCHGLQKLYLIVQVCGLQVVLQKEWYVSIVRHA